MKAERVFKIRMQAGFTNPQAQIPHDQQILFSQYSALCTGPPVYTRPGSAGIAHLCKLLNSSQPNGSRPSTLPTSPPVVTGSLQACQEKETRIPRAQGRPEVLIKICHTISSRMDHWYPVLDFTPNARGRAPRRQELAELISASEKMGLNEKTLSGWMRSIKALGDLAIAEEANEASTGGSKDTSNNSSPIDEKLKEACMALAKLYNAGVASGRFNIKGQQAQQRFASALKLVPAPAPGVVSSPEQTLLPQHSAGSSHPPAVSGENVRDDPGIAAMQVRKRKNEQSGEEEGAHRGPKKGGMGALNEPALNFGEYLKDLTAPITALKELTALRAQAESDHEKKLYTKKINKILAAMDSDTDSG
jgi:hypothetical protein